MRLPHHAGTIIAEHARQAVLGRLLPVLLLFAGLTVPGCRLPGTEGPVPKKLATCRELSQKALAAAEQGHDEQAEALLEKALRTCPVDYEARRHYAEILWKRGAKNEAIAQLEEAVRLMDQDPAIRVRLAEMQLDRGFVAEAQETAEEALDLDPKLASAWTVRGRTMLAAGRKTQALADFHRALGFAPGDRQILLEVAELYRRSNQPQRALASLQALADTYNPGEEPQSVLRLTASAYKALGRYEDAVESLAAAVIRESPTAELFFELGNAELLAGRPAAAAAAAEQALRLQPDHRPTQRLLQQLQVARQNGPTIRR